jgi:hypothetical protein
MENKDMKMLWRDITELTDEWERATDEKMVWASELLYDELTVKRAQADVTGNELKELLTAIAESDIMGTMADKFETYLPEWVNGYITITYNSSLDTETISAHDFILIVKDGNKIEYLTVA